MKSFGGDSHSFLPNGKVNASALHRITHWTRRRLSFLRKKETTYNFSEIETSPSGSSEIQKLAREAGQAAASEAKAVGIPKVFATNDQIIQQFPDGRRIILIGEGEAEREYFRHFKSGVLHARKK